MGGDAQRAVAAERNGDDVIFPLIGFLGCVALVTVSKVRLVQERKARERASEARVTAPVEQRNLDPRMN